MKITEKAKITLKRGLNKIFRVTNVEKLEAQREAMLELYNKSKDQLNELKASKKQKKEQLERKKTQLNKLNETNTRLLEEGKEEKLKQGFEFKKQVEHEIDVLNNSIKSYGSLIANLTSQLKSYKSKTDKIKNNIDELKAKAEFSKNVDKFKNTMRNLDCSNINDISDEIDKNYYKSELDLNDITESDKDVDSFVKDDDVDFEKYKESLKRKNKR